ncbi:hypothetical protein V1509DRAFT_654034 [Lipomyces kononenkoae]
MASQDPFNSSSQEYEIQRPYFNAGNASIESMMSKRYKDRKSSKKRLREQADTRGAPTSVYQRALWVRRLEAYLEMNDISVDDEDGPSGDVLYRFLHTIVSHLKPRGGHDKPAIQLSSVKSAVLQLVRGLEFKYPHFKLSGHHAARIDAMLSDLAKEGKLLRGQWSKGEWLGVVLFEKMARAWLQTALDHGCLSWDVQISRLLSISLVVALACRAGEVAVSRGYTTESLKWGHATIVICFEKGKKYQTNDDRTVVFRSQRDLSKNIIYRPVIPAISQLKRAFLELDKPATVNQLLSSTIQLGLVAGVLAKIKTHDWRRGSAKDIAHLKNITGVADHATAIALGHSRASAAKGITDTYVGNLGAPFKKVRLSCDETTNFCLDNNLDHTQRNDRRIAGELIRAMRISEWIEAEKNREVTPTTHSQVKANSVASFALIDPQLLLSYGENSRSSLEDAECVMSNEGDACVDVCSANTVMRTLTGTLEAAVGEDGAVDRELVGLALSALETSQMLLLPGDEFVDAFCRINVVRNANIHEKSKSAVYHLETRAPSGNARDPPTQFEYKCSNHTKGCTFTAKSKALLVLHCQTCDTEKVGVRTTRDLYHKPILMTTLRPFTTGFPRSVTRKTAHPIDPTSCTFPGCTSQMIFAKYQAYTNHLRRSHLLMTAESRKPYLPTLSVSYWRNTECPLGGLSKCSTLFTSCKNLANHLILSTHKLSKEEARKITDKIQYGNR